jgi:hypothetical protein
MGGSVGSAVRRASNSGHLRNHFAVTICDVTLPSLSLRGIPDDTYEGLRQLAARNHRSMQERARLMIERDVRLSR